MAVDQDIERAFSNANQPLPSDSLFAEPSDKVRNRVAEVLAGRSERPLTHPQRKVLQELSWRIGAAKIADLGVLSTKVDIPARKVREIVQELREQHGIMIGASHDSSVSGYYLIANAEEEKATIDPMRNGAVAVLRVVKAMTGLSTDDLLRKLRKDLDKESV